MLNIIVLFSGRVAGLERRAAGLCCLLVLILICANVVVRTLRVPVYWIDEAAVYAMIWMAFLAASAALQSNSHISMTLLNDKLSGRARHLLAISGSGLVLLFALCLMGLAWLWFNPVGVMRAGGDLAIFSRGTFNFIYSEPTASIGLKKFWFWLIIPWFTLSLTLHGLANLLKAWQNPPANSGEG